MAIIKKSTFKASEKSIQRLLVSSGDFIKRYDMMLPNCYLNNDNEADLFAIRKSGLCDEFEIKTSRADFLNDAKKRVKYRQPENKRDLFGVGEYEQWCLDGRVEGTEPWIMNKREAYEKGLMTPNYFWYVLYEDIVVREHELPDWAGLIIVSKYGLLSEKRKPKRLHSNKVSDKLVLKVAKKGLFRYLDVIRGWREEK